MKINVHVLMCGMVLLGGCAGSGLEEAKKAKLPASEINKALYEGYVELSEVEYREGDYTDSDTFAGRALQAAANASFGPEEIGQRRLPDDKVSELANARDRLVKVLAGGAAQRKPRDAARAQVMFDCWMQEQEENFQPDDIEQCRSEFKIALAKIEEKPPARQVYRSPAPPPAPEPPRNFIVFFDFDQSVITAEAAAILRDAANTARTRAPVRIVTTGHADRSGTTSYNRALSERRAIAVRTQLQQNGIDPSTVSTFARGETDPLVATPDGVREPQNRRVELVLQ